MNDPRELIDKHRMAGLQDGVYAIAMTLLVLELKLPGLPDPSTSAQLLEALLSIWPKALTWLLSFLVLGVFWISDVRSLTVFAVLDRFMTGLSLMRLAFVSLLPFTTALMGDHGGMAAGSALYALHIVVLAVLHVVRLEYIHRNPDLRLSGSEKNLSEARVRAIATLVSALAALGLAFVVPGYNMLALLLMLVFRIGRRAARHDH